jgi:hypothetical protein
MLSAAAMTSRFLGADEPQTPPAAIAGAAKSRWQWRGSWNDKMGDPQGRDQSEQDQADNVVPVEPGHASS